MDNAFLKSFTLPIVQLEFLYNPLMKCRIEKSSPELSRLVSNILGKTTNWNSDFKISSSTSSRKDNVEITN